jgi:hypothetical protein
LQAVVREFEPIVEDELGKLTAEEIPIKPSKAKIAVVID